MSLATDLRPTEHLFYRHMSGGRPQTMSSWKGGGGESKIADFTYQKDNKVGDGVKLPIFRRHSLWTASCTNM